MNGFKNITPNSKVFYFRTIMMEKYNGVSRISQQMSIEIQHVIVYGKKQIHYNLRDYMEDL